MPGGAGGEDECDMQDLSVLTPPLLMCAVVIIAIVAFLRHEMNRSRTDKSAPGENMSGLAEHLDEDLESQQDHDPDARRTPSRDS
jgi:hypothetical protein